MLVLRGFITGLIDFRRFCIIMFQPNKNNFGVSSKTDTINKVMLHWLTF